MPVVPDIIQCWRGPRRFIRGKLDQGIREDRALAVLIGACGLIFVSQWPRIAREAQLDPATPLDGRIGGALMAVVFILPLVMYLMAGVSHLLARAFGGKGSAFGARLALFWALFASTPAMLLHGLLRGMLGPTGAVTGIGVLVLAGFVYLWIAMLREAQH